MARERKIEKRDNRIQMTGSEAGLMDGPHDMRQSAFAGGRVEFTGSQAELSKNTTPLGIFNKNVRGGRVEMTGSEATLDRTPRRGYDSYETVISINSQNSSEHDSGWPGRK